MGDAMETVPLPLPCQESPDRGRTHLEEQLPRRIIDMEMSMNGEVLHEEGYACCQTDWSQEGAGTPDGDEYLLDGRAIPGRTVSLNVLRGVSHEKTVSQEVPLTCLVQNPGGILPLVPRRFTEVI